MPDPTDENKTSTESPASDNPPPAPPPLQAGPVDSSTPAAPSAKLVTAADLVGIDTDTMPAVSGEGAPSPTPPNPPPPPANDGPKKTGRPLGSKDSYKRPIGRDGRFQKAGPAPKPAEGAAGPATPGDAPGPGAPFSVPPRPVETPPVDYAALSMMVFGTTTSIACAFFGPEWQPRSKEEADMMLKGWENYLRAKNVPDLPPGIMLLALYLVYSGPRLREPNTMNKLKMIWGGVAGWFRKLFSRRPRPNTNL